MKYILRYGKLLLPILLSIVLGALTACGGGTTPNSPSNPKIVQGTNWMGYTIVVYQFLDTTPTPTPTTPNLSVQGTLQVGKSVSCTRNGKRVTGQISHWVGVGGALPPVDSILDQAGVTYKCDKGVLTLFVWTETAPQSPPVPLGDKFPIAPGDSVTIQITEAVGNTQAVITNQGKWQTKVNFAVAANARSVEWEAEYTTANQPQNMPAFGTLNFSNCTYMVGTAKYSLGSPGTGHLVERSDLYQGSGGVVSGPQLAVTNPIAGNTFSVTAK